MTTTAGALHMVRAEIDLGALHRWMGSKRLVDQDHAMHCLLTECLGDLAPRPFRLIAPRDCAKGVLYGYTRADADALREAAAICADPLQCRIMPAETLDGKLMPTSWQEGKRLGFEVRIRPVVRLQDPSRVPADKLRRFRTRSGEADAPRPGKECDVFQWEAMLHPKNGMKRSRERVYADWLACRLKQQGGADVDVEQTKLVSFQRVRAVRHRHARHSEGPDAVMRGALTVTASDGFAELLARGVGRHRAYGFGMLLLRPTRGR